MRLRSLLYVPAHAERFLSKAHERGADAIILDLEDAVPPDAKVRAREMLMQTVPAVGQKGAQVFVRLNADPAMQLADAVAACRAGAFGLFVAKARDAELIATLAGGLSELEAELGRPPLHIVPMLEDAGAVLDARELAQAPRVLGLVVGGEDLALSLGAQPTPEVLRHPKLLAHYAAKAEGKLSLGMLRSVADYSDLDALQASAEEARAFGFDGATCIHPSGVAILNAAFTPSAEEQRWARGVLAAAEQSGEAAFSFEGRMVDAPVLQRARAILERS